MKVKRTERGWAGHFCCSYDCKFRRNTLLEYGDIKIVVSTVGNYWPQHKMDNDRKLEKWKHQIGANRFYETMAFYSKPNDDYYHDADVSKEIYFNSQWAINELNEHTDKLANKMHEDVVKELSKKLRIGKV